jgi:hypothetical protein
MTEVKYKDDKGNMNDFPRGVAYIVLPNGDEYSLNYSDRERGLIVSKIHGSTTDVSIKVVDSGKIIIQ